MSEENGIINNIGIVHILLCRAMAKDIDKDSNCNISPIQIKILKYLYTHQTKDVYQHDIENFFSIRRSTVSGVLKTMEKNKMIKRVDNPNDARSKKIILTLSAQEKADLMRQKAERMEQLLDKGITKSELIMFLSVLDKIKLNLTNYERNNKND